MVVFHAVVSCSDDGATMFLEESESPSSNNNSSSPVLFFDCKATGGNIYKDHIINPLRTELILKLRFSHVSNHTLISNASLHHWLQALGYKIIYENNHLTILNLNI